MAEDKNSKVTQNQDRINKLIDGLTLFDDDLMSRVFDKNIEATELLLRIILERKIKVISVIGQEEMKSAAHNPTEYTAAHPVPEHHTPLIQLS